jgi:hypothetical protein
MPVKIQSIADPTSTDMKYMISVESTVSRFIAEEFVAIAARMIAEKYVEEHYQEIAALIDQNALATLSVAEAASAVKKSLEVGVKQIVSAIPQKHDKEVWQRGVFGGMRKIL